MRRKNLLFFPVVGMLFSLVGCGSQSGPDLSIKYDDLVPQYLDDNYRTFYQIFPVSFADSDNDGIGDLQGIIDKLDYIEQMNYTGIWLTPIHPSTYYHHYDVEDYSNIDPQLGNFEIFDNLVSECHRRNIKIILDLVVNHSSNEHKWFKASYNAAKAGNFDNKNALLYNWVTCGASSCPSGYSKVNGSDTVAYEARFGSGMPDLNSQPILDNPTDSNIGNKLKDIFKVWLVDHDVDGFRLDAVTHYFENNEVKNRQFMTWLNDECKAIKPDCYLVGEGNWGSNSVENQGYQASGIDSFFQFGNCIKNEGFIKQAVVNKRADAIYNGLVRNEENAAGGIEAPFLGNHDLPRFVGGVNGRSEEANVKFSLGCLQLLKGATFTYYGDEVGMASQDSVRDGYFRLPIKWGDSYTCNPTAIKLINVDVPNIDQKLSYPYKDVNAQLKSASSIANYAKKANLIRLAFPELARGSFTKTNFGSDNSKVIISRTYNDSTIKVFINASEDVAEINYADYGEKLLAELCPKGKVLMVEKDSTTVKVPAKSILIIK